MEEKLLKLFEGLSKENKHQLLDYAMMLWEMDQSEEQLKAHLGIPTQTEDPSLNRLTSQHYLKKDNKEIN